MNAQKRGVEVQLYTFITLALIGVGGQHHALAAWPSGKSPGANWTQGWVGLVGWSGMVWKMSPPPGFEPATMQPVKSRYTVYAILASRICSDRAKMTGIYLVRP